MAVHCAEQLVRGVCSDVQARSKQKKRRGIDIAPCIAQQHTHTERGGSFACWSQHTSWGRWASGRAPALMAIVNPWFDCFARQPIATAYSHRRVGYSVYTFRIINSRVYAMLPTYHKSKKLAMALYHPSIRRTQHNTRYMYSRSSGVWMPP